MAASTFSASAVTSGPVPSPGITAIFSEESLTKSTFSRDRVKRRILAGGARPHQFHASSIQRKEAKKRKEKRRFYFPFAPSRALRLCVNRLDVKAPLHYANFDTSGSFTSFSSRKITSSVVIPSAWA